MHPHNGLQFASCSIWQLQLCCSFFNIVSDNTEKTNLSVGKLNYCKSMNVKATSPMTRSQKLLLWLPTDIHNHARFFFLFTLWTVMSYKNSIKGKIS